MRSFLIVLVACGSSTPNEPRPQPTLPIAIDAAPDAAITFDQTTIEKAWPDGCFTIRAAGRTYESGPRCAEQRRPYSTFKIANALIALDANVLDGADAQMTWDKQRVPDEERFLDSWRKPHSLRTAIAVSAVPYFRTLALQIGEERMKAGLEKLAYGNRDLGGGLDKFWLSRGALRISAREQLAIMDALANKTLPVSKKAQDALSEITVLAKTTDAILHGKTGSGPLEHGKGDWIVWQVGWIERDGTTIPYAAWMESTAKTVDEARAAREERLRAILAALAVFRRP